jgi:hypothetical protein
MIGFLGTVILVSGFSGGTIQAFATVFVVGMVTPKRDRDRGDVHSR